MIGIQRILMTTRMRIKTLEDEDKIVLVLQVVESTWKWSFVAKDTSSCSQNFLRKNLQITLKKNLSLCTQEERKLFSSRKSIQPTPKANFTDFRVSSARTCQSTHMRDPQGHGGSHHELDQCKPFNLVCPREWHVLWRTSSRMWQREGAGSLWKQSFCHLSKQITCSVWCLCQIPTHLLLIKIASEVSGAYHNLPSSLHCML